MGRRHKPPRIQHGHQISFRVKFELYRKLDSIAEASDLKKADIARLALAEYLSKHDTGERIDLVKVA